MDRKTKIDAEDGKQEIFITREFDLPLELLFKAYKEAEIVEQWMGTKVLKLENKKQGGFQFETTDPKGNKHGFGGAIHEFVPNKKTARRFRRAARFLIHPTAAALASASTRSRKLEGNHAFAFAASSMSSSAGDAGTR